MKASPPSQPVWMSVVLFLAGVQNLSCGIWICVFPADSFSVVLSQTAEEPLTSRLWQGVGMIMGLFGIAYIIAAREPARHWPIVLVGLLAKIGCPVGLCYAVSQGEVSARVLPLIYPNDLIWWVPFALILCHGQHSEQGVTPAAPPES